MAHNLMGIALTSSGKPEEGNAQFQAALESNPEFIPALKNLALNELALNHLDEARGHFEQVLKREPEDPVAHLSLGEIHYAKHEFGPAVDEYRKSAGLVERDPRTVLRFAEVASVKPGHKGCGRIGTPGPGGRRQSPFRGRSDAGPTGEILFRRPPIRAGQERLPLTRMKWDST